MDLTAVRGRVSPVSSCHPPHTWQTAATRLVATRVRVRSLLSLHVQTESNVTNSLTRLSSPDLTGNVVLARGITEKGDFFFLLF